MPGNGRSVRSATPWELLNDVRYVMHLQDRKGKVHQVRVTICDDLDPELSQILFAKEAIRSRAEGFFAEAGMAIVSAQWQEPTVFTEMPRRAAQIPTQHPADELHDRRQARNDRRRT